MSIGYTWEKLYVAVRALAAGNGSVQERLADAYISALIRLNPDDFPEQLQDDFRALQIKMTSVAPTAQEGSVLATVRTMSAEEASEIAKKIVDMYDHVARMLPAPD